MWAPQGEINQLVKEKDETAKIHLVSESQNASLRENIEKLEETLQQVKGEKGGNLLTVSSALKPWKVDEIILDRFDA